MSKRTVIVSVVSILLAAGAAPTPARAQAAQGKTHVGGKPSGLVSLIATLAAGDNEPASVVTAEGGSEAFELPAGKVLVVTDVYAEGPGDVGARFVGICTDGVCSNAVLRLSFDTSQELSRSLTLTSGVVFRAPPDVACFLASDGSCTVRLYGYLAKDK